MDSLVLQTAIGLVFVFATGAAAVSIVTESISRYIGLRSEYLLRGLRTLLDGGGDFELPIPEAITGSLRGERKQQASTPPPSATTAAVTAMKSVKAVADARLERAKEAVEESPEDPVRRQALTKATELATSVQGVLGSVVSVVEPLGTAGVGAQHALVARMMAHPLVGATAQYGNTQAKAGDAPLTNKQRRQLPSYISSRSFARALIDIVVPDASERTTMKDVRDAITAADLPPELERALLALADKTTTDIATFRANLEHWYDDQMARVSGWYKRHVRWISLAIGVVIVLAFNVNALVIARSLYTDEAVRGAVVSQASQASKCDKGPAACLQELRTNIGSVRGAGLPIGWVTVPECAVEKSGCNWLERRGLWVHVAQGDAWWLTEVSHLGVLLLGWIIMVVALLPGANFWFDILGKLGTLRNSGPKPKST